MKGNVGLFTKKLENILYSNIPNFNTLDVSLKEAFSILIDEPVMTHVIIIPNTNFKFYLEPLREWEEREVERVLANYDAYTKERLRKVEVLTFSIVGAESPDGQTFSFATPDEKFQLRTLLLSFHPQVIDFLYQFYLRLRMKYVERVNALFGTTVEEALTKGFFQEVVGNNESN